MSYEALLGEQVLLEKFLFFFSEHVLRCQILLQFQIFLSYSLHTDIRLIRLHTVKKY